MLHEDLKPFVSGIRSELLPILYSLAKYHERYRFTQVLYDELLARGVKGEDILLFDASIVKLYEMILNDDEL